MDENNNKLKNITEDTSILLLNPRFIGPCLAGIFCLIVATVVGVSYLFTMSTVLLALPVASYIIGIKALKRYVSSSEPQITTVQGKRTPITVRILAKNYELDAQELNVKLPFPKTISIEDNQEAETLPDGQIQASIWFIPGKRGKVTLGPIVISASDPLGMFRLKRKMQETTELIIYPRPVAIDLGLFTGSSKETSVNHPQARRSVRGDFAGVREYREGDELRRIHWKTTARTQQLSVVELEETTVGSATILLDLSKGNDFGQKVVTSLDVAAGAAAYAVTEYLHYNVPVRLILPDKDNIDTVEVRASRDIPQAMAKLAEAKANASIRITEVLRKSTGKGSIILITTQLGEDLVNAVKEVRAAGIRIQLVCVDPTAFGKAFQENRITELERAGVKVQVIREVTE